MKHDVVLATRNLHKLKEIEMIMAGLNICMRTFHDFPDMPDVAETGSTFAENALLKARASYQMTGLLTLSDDSGLEVDALDGEPGVYSARFAGVDGEEKHAANNAKLFQMLQSIPDTKRGAQFHCTVAIIGPEIEETVDGIIRGRITTELRGSGGFGYDPLFIPEGYDQTFAELGHEIKNRISHRSQAFSRAKERLEKYFTDH